MTAENLTHKSPASPSAGLFTVAGTMRRVRVEAALRGSATDRGALASYSADPFSLPNWGSAESHVEIKAQYELHELLRGTDADFVINAYRAVLRRPPDGAGLDGFVNQLRSGGMDKIEILSELRWSGEGVARGVHVNGLLAPRLLRKLGRLPVLGLPVRWLYGWLTVHKLAYQQRLSENILGRDVQDLGRHVGRLGDQFGEGLQRHEDTLAIFYEHLQQQASKSEQAAAANQKKQRQLENELAALRASIDTQAGRWQQQEQQREQEQLRAHQLDGMYAQFEDEFRGSAEMIRARLAPYVTMLQEAGVGSAEGKVLDLGAGRGEWLQLLRESGLHARGIDTNQVFIEICKENGLDVDQTDALSALADTPEGSLGAVTTMHLVEHLTFEDMMGLIDGSLRALQPGGMLIIETPNPENLRVGSFTFYLDPTHRNPLPPVMLRWLVEQRGFEDVQIHRLSEHRPWPVLPRVPAESDAAVPVNALLDWAEIAPDYAIVARKPHD